MGDRRTQQTLDREAETVVERRLRSALDDAASGVQSVHAVPAAGLDRARRQLRHRVLAVRAGAAGMVAVVLLAGLQLVIVRDRSADVNDTAGSPVVAGSGTFNPMTASSVPFPAGPDVELLQGVSATATDSGFVVWGGLDSGTTGSDPIQAPSVGAGWGSSYDSRTGTWTEVPAGPLEKRAFAAMAWTGTEVVVAGGSRTVTHAGSFADVAALDLSTGTWRSLPALPGPVTAASAVAVAGQLLIGGGSGQPSEVLIGDGVNAWRTVDVGHPVQGLARSRDEVVVFGFARSSRNDLELSVLDPTTGTTTRLPDLHLADGVISVYAAGASDDGTIVAAAQVDSLLVLHRLVSGTSSWEAAGTSTVQGGDVLSGRSGDGALFGQLFVSEGGAEVRSVTPWAVADIDVASGSVTSRLEVASRRCASSTTSTATATDALAWTSAWCPEGARLTLAAAG